MEELKGAYKILYVEI
jgi:hypothetical protein